MNRVPQRQSARGSAGTGNAYVMVGGLSFAKSSHLIAVHLTGSAERDEGLFDSPHGSIWVR